MQSLGQAVYRFIYKYSPKGVTKRAITREMDSRGYHVGEGQVDLALDRNINFIELRGNRFVKKVPYWRGER